MDTLDMKKKNSPLLRALGQGSSNETDWKEI